MTAPASEKPLIADMLHRARLEDPKFDGTRSAIQSATSAVLSIVDALAYLYGNPNRTAYINEFAEEIEGDSELARAASLLEIAAHAFADSVAVAESRE